MEEAELRPGNVVRIPDGRSIFLLRIEQLEALPKGTELYSFRGTRKIWGRDPVDTDTRGGYLAFGPIYEPGLTEKLVGRELEVPLDAQTPCAFEIRVVANSGTAMERLIDSGWTLSLNPGGPLLLRKVAVPSEVSRDFEPFGIAASLGHSLRATVTTDSGTYPVRYYADGIGAVKYDRSASSEGLETP